MKNQPYVCGIDAAIDVVGGKWKVLILWELQSGTKRFGELKKGIPGVTEKMLIQHLRELERDEIVHRTVYPEVPPRVEYDLTDIGVELNNALRPLGAWGMVHKARIEAIRSGEADEQGDGEASTASTKSTKERASRGPLRAVK